MSVRKQGFLAVSLNNPVDIELASAKNGQSEIPGPNKDTIQNHLSPARPATDLHPLPSILILTIAILAIHASVVTSKGSSSFSRSTHSSSAHPLLPITKINPVSRHHRHHNPPQGVLHLLRLRPTARTQTSPVNLLKNQPSPAPNPLPSPA
jgi:hypothetical protein